MTPIKTLQHVQALNGIVMTENVVTPLAELLPAPAATVEIPPPLDVARQRRLVACLRELIRQGSAPVRLLETHISFVLLTGTYAYKIKKAVKLGFLDFQTLEARKHFCEEELRLNQRLAPSLYVDVVAITGSVEDPAVDGPGGVLDYAVRMYEFAQEALLCNVAARNQLQPAHIDALARMIADFHAASRTPPPERDYGTADRIIADALANLEEMVASQTEAEDRSALHALSRWTHAEGARIRSMLEHRRLGGSVRECHGDLHLGNIALVDGKVTPFDCIEFNPAMRWIDTMSEIAFTVMDLVHRGHSPLAYRFLSAYLEHSGDYDGTPVLRFYLVYRALVRAKVACLRAQQAVDPGEREAQRMEYRGHVALATAYAQDEHPAVVLMHGASGSGKTTLSQLVLEHTGAVRIRTDVERKRLAGLAAGERSGSDVGTGIYAPHATQAVYEYIRACARSIVHGGFPVLVDGAFLLRWQRDTFRDLATEYGVPFMILDCVASAATLEARVEARSRLGADASEADVAVLRQQLATSDALAVDELPFVFACDAEASFEEALSEDAWRKMRGRIRAPNASRVTSSSRPST